MPLFVYTVYFCCFLNENWVMFFFLVASIACGGSIATEITPPLHGEQLKQFQRLSEASAFGGDKSWSLCYHEPWRCRTHFFYCWNMLPFLPIIIGSVEITLILKETHLGRTHFFTEPKRLAWQVPSALQGLFARAEDPQSTWGSHTPRAPCGGKLSHFGDSVGIFSKY